MDLRSSELDEPDPSSPLCPTSDCKEPNTESDFSPPCKSKVALLQTKSNIVVSPSSSSVCSPDHSDSGSDSDSSENGDLCSSTSTSKYYQDLQSELECHPLEEDTNFQNQMLQLLAKFIPMVSK